ncbi:copper transporter [Metallumcola ferriviriculae]|uniref:Copper transporter n=1 Tax=Metallumcola ferriviriculae TaxID=3039180 RepID=A0AAU0UNE1_9FIRM|nr:copper transporter [Desulfitibacteraceae bacterium MK1]
MIDFRYHITTLVAVFLALALGILVGTTMVSDQMLVQQQKQMIDSLEIDFAALREQNRTSRQEMAVFKATTDNYSKFAHDIYPLLVSGRLQGIQAALIVTGSGKVSDLAADLSLSGLEISPVITVPLPMEKGDGEEEDTAVTKADISFSEAKILAKQLVEFAISGKVNDPLQAWQSRGIFEIHTPHNDTKPDIVLVVGGSETENPDWVKNFDIPLIRGFKEQEKIVVGTEYSQVGFSYMPYYQLEGISTVDNIDLVIGQTALTFLLEGRPGHYGIKPTAKALLPEFD